MGEIKDAIFQRSYQYQMGTLQLGEKYVTAKEYSNATNKCSPMPILSIHPQRTQGIKQS